MQASVVMHNQLNVFMTVFSLFPNEEFKRLRMTVAGWQATTSIPRALSESAQGFRNGYLYTPRSQCA